MNRAEVLKQYRVDKNLTEADLRGANLREANLGGADLGRASLHEANLREADLGGADLGRANLREADLRGANLQEADLTWTDLYAKQRIVQVISSGRQIIAIDDDVRIGCLRHPLAYWLEHYQAIGTQEGYSKAQIALYGKVLEALKV